MRYCGIVTIYKGVCVYTWSAMGMPGSETTLEKLMCRVLGDHLQASRICFKISWRPVLWRKHSWRIWQHLISVMTALDTCGLRLSATKTIICPRSTTILGWIWTRGTLSASSHKVSVLSTCKLPDSAHCLRSFIGAYKILFCVLPICAYAIAPQESAISGLQSKDKIKWSEELMKHFCTAKRKL